MTLFKNICNIAFLSPVAFQIRKLMNICLHYCAREVDYLGGDKDAEICKDPASEEMVHYKDALADLVKAVSIVHFLGKGPENV